MLLDAEHGLMKMCANTAPKRTVPHFIPESRHLGVASPTLIPSLSSEAHHRFVARASDDGGGFCSSLAPVPQPGAVTAQKTAFWASSSA